MKILWFIIRFIMGFFFTCIFFIIAGLFFSTGKGSYDENTALGFSGIAGALPGIGFLVGIVWATIGILFPAGKKPKEIK